MNTAFPTPTLATAFHARFAAVLSQFAALWLGELRRFQKTPLLQDGQPSSILVVDDEVDVRDTLSMLLSLDGFYVRTCKSRDDAVELLKQERPDLIIVDWNMPGMILETFIETVRQRYGALPVALHSGATKASTMADSLSVSFLPKTTAPDQLTSTIRKLLQAHSR